jgi:hypothetical protein
MTNREKTIGKIISYFEENEEIFNTCIEELDSYNGYLNGDRFYEMEVFDEFYSATDPLEVLRRAFYGYDADTYHTDSYGHREYGAFNPNRDYFSFNGYGNLVSSDYKDYSNFLDAYAVEAMSNNRYYIDTIDDHAELAELFDELERDDDKNNEA